MARTRECPSCASSIPDDQDHCFLCGYEFAGPPARRSIRTWVTLGVLGFLLVIFLIPYIRMALRAFD